MDDPQTLTVSLLTLGDPDRLTGGYLYHRRVADRAHRSRARIDFVSLPAWRFPLPTIAAPTLLRTVAGSHPDVLLIDSIAAAFVGPWLFWPGLPPLVAILHQPPGGMGHRWARRWAQSLLDRQTYRRVRRLLVTGADLADELRGAGVPDRLLRVVAPGRDLAESPVAPAAELRAGRRTAVLSVGNWQERKGLLDLLEAVARLPAEAATLHLVGDTEADPDYAARVRRRLAAPDLADRVVVHGLRSPAQVAGLYRAADVFALPSVQEPYGMVYGEAMQAGLPVVGWAAGNLPNLVDDGVEGMVVPVGDQTALAAALKSLTLDEPLRRRMSVAAAARATRLQTWDDTARILFSELRAVANEP